MENRDSRIDRIESTLTIQQLPVRYAMAVDGAAMARGTSYGAMKALVCHRGARACRRSGFQRLAGSDHTGARTARRVSDLAGLFGKAGLRRRQTALAVSG